MRYSAIDNEFHDISYLFDKALKTFLFLTASRYTNHLDTQNIKFI